VITVHWQPGQQIKNRPTAYMYRLQHGLQLIMRV